MKAIYLDCFSGISGNMLLGAFLMLGVPRDYLVRELGRLFSGDAFTLEIDPVTKCGIHATYVDVLLHTEKDAAHEAHAHRNYAEIRRMIEGAGYVEAVVKRALDVFAVLAEAEGKVHGKKPDEVTFHEVGAVDSIVDIVGTALCLDYLGIERVFASPVNTGTGEVQCAHGVMPVPAPATAELLLGWEAYHTGTKRELTTPTGAAVLRALASESEAIPHDFRTERIAYGAGGWDLDTPNVLRVYLGEYQGGRTSDLVILEANIDDMNPENYDYIEKRLFLAGARDVWMTPILMKKNRPATMLSCLVEQEKVEEMAGIFFAETTSIGLRVMPVEARLEATRRVAVSETKFGKIHCKISAWDGNIVSVSPEYEDCKEKAAEYHVPLKRVQYEAVRELHRKLED